MTRQDRFEKVYAQLHEMDTDLIRDHRFIDVDGYSLPRLATAYRVYCATMDSVVIELPPRFNIDDQGCVYPHPKGDELEYSAVVKSIESAGVKWK